MDEEVGPYEVCDLLVQPEREACNGRAVGNEKDESRQRHCGDRQQTEPVDRACESAVLVIGRAAVRKAAELSRKVSKHLGEARDREPWQKAAEACLAATNDCPHPEGGDDGEVRHSEIFMKAERPARRLPGKRKAHELAADQL